MQARIKHAWLTSLGLLLVLLALYAPLSTSCDCEDTLSCYDRALVPCEVGVFSDLLGASTGRMAAADFFIAGSMLAGALLLTLALPRRRMY